MTTNNVAFFILLAILAGMAVPIQASLNVRLSESLGSPIAAAATALGMGCVTLVVFMLVSGVPLTSFSALATTPVGYIIGGIFGAFFVGSMVYTIPRLGVALALGLTVGGQMLVAMLIDHFGWMGREQRGLNAWRLLGAVLITAGVALIKKF